jgi:glycosyltransferase involved in cell wall biosynthesis
MKHVLVIGKYFPPEFGGVERYTHEVALLAAKAHRVTVLVHGKTPRDSVERSGNITVIRCGTNKVISAQPISMSMLHHMRSVKADLVHFNAPNFWAGAMLLLSGYDGPIVVTHHADVFGRPLLKPLVMPIYHRIVHKAACVVVNSLKNSATSKDLPIDAGPFVSIPHGLDANTYANTAADRQSFLDNRRALFGDAPVVGFIGRFVRYKGLSVIVEALARLQHVHALMIGDGPLRLQTEEQARALGVRNRMHFLGNLDEPAKIRHLAMMDILLLPSTDTTEAFGVVQIEAQLMGLPVVASRLPTGVTDVTLDGETGLLVPPRDSTALAAAVETLIGDPGFASQLGRAGRAHALRNFTLDVFRQRFNELFEIVLSGEPIRLTTDSPGSPEWIKEQGPIV